MRRLIILLAAAILQRLPLLLLRPTRVRPRINTSRAKDLRASTAKVVNLMDRSLILLLPRLPKATRLTNNRVIRAKHPHMIPTKELLSQASSTIINHRTVNPIRIAQGLLVDSTAANMAAQGDIRVVNQTTVVSSIKAMVNLQTKEVVIISSMAAATNRTKGINSTRVATTEAMALSRISESHQLLGSPSNHGEYGMELVTRSLSCMTADIMTKGEYGEGISFDFA